MQFLAPAGSAALLRALLIAVSVLLQEWKRTAEQFDPEAVWLRVCQTITTTVTGFAWLGPLQSAHYCAERLGLTLCETLADSMGEASAPATDSRVAPNSCYRCSIIGQST